MIKKLIRKLLGRPAATEPDAAAPHGAVPSPDAAAAPPKRRAPRGKSKAKRDSTQPTVVPAAVHGIDPALISANAVRVTDTLQQAGHRAFIVGGAVRDLLLGVEPKDFDIATDATPEQVRQLFRRARLIGRRFQIVHVQFGQDLIEVSTFRALVDGAPPAAETLPQSTDDDADDSAPGAGRRRRNELDRRTHAVDASSGRVLRDNVWGEQHEDATRRDFTINAMYYDPATQTVLDYHNGMADIRARLLRMIGEPTARFREDPVRMLRVVRFAAKLGFEIEPATRAPIAHLSTLLDDVPAARLFDELLKLLLSGHALACLQCLRAEGLDAHLLPSLATIFNEPHAEKFVVLALTNSDIRVRAGKTISPAFLFAALLWREVQQAWRQRQAQDELPIPALHAAMDEVLWTQTRKLAIQRRYSGDMKEIWAMQPRLEKPPGRSALRLLEHQRFRAAYDFLLLRCEAGELDATCGQWWTEFIDGNPEAREALLAQSGKERPRRRRRRSPPGGSGGNKSRPPEGDAGGIQGTNEPHSRDSYSDQES